MAAVLEKRPRTQLHRAYRIFEQMRPQLLTARGLAMLMQVGVREAYDYVKRLKAARCIEPQGGTGKVPAYGLVEGAGEPPADARGRKRVAA